MTNTFMRRTAAAGLAALAVAGLSLPAMAQKTKLTVYTALENVNPEVAQDILANGVHLAGGGALLRGLAEKLTEKTGINFVRDSDPLTCVVRGVGRVVENIDNLKRVCIAA